MNNIETIDYPAPKQDYKVLVRCYTYNHSKYIEDALNGFALQQTNFPFVCLVVDDASTDGEQEVIKDWMDRECDMCRAEIIDIPTSVVIIVPHRANASCTFAFYLMKQNLYKAKEEKMRHVTPWREKCKYEALCEGDDYWTDPLKLQKQVDVMENDSSVAMVYTKAKLYNQSKQQFVEEMGANTTFEELLCNFNNAIPTASVLFRTRCYKEYQNEINPQQYKWKMGDYPFNLYLTMKYKVFMIDSLSVVYRIVTNSASHNQNEEKLIPYYKSIFEIKKHYFELVSGSEDLRVKMCHHYLGFAYKLYCKVPKGDIKNLIHEVYSYMLNPTLYEKIINKIVTAYKCPNLIKQTIGTIYAKMSF